jgi:lipoprotein NlpI
MQEPAAALTDYSRVLEIEPENSETYFLRAWIQVRLNRSKEALADVTRALQIDPYDSNSYSLRAWLRSLSGDLHGALEDINLGTELDPTNPWLIYGRGCILYNHARWAEAAPEFGRLASGVRDRLADYAAIRLWLVNARNERSKADAELRAHLENRAHGKRDDWEVAIACYVLGRLDEEGLLKIAGEKSEQVFQSLFYIGSKKAIEGDRAGAREFFGRCIKAGIYHYFEYPSAVAELGRCL